MSEDYWSAEYKQSILDDLDEAREEAAALRRRANNLTRRVQELERQQAVYRRLADACRKLLHYRERNTLNFQLCKADDFHRLIGLALDELEAKGDE